MPLPAAPPAWLDELPRRAGPPWVSMGVRPLDLDDWLVFDDDSPAELALKAELLAARPSEVFLAEPGSEAAGAEVLDLVTAWCGAHGHPATAPPPDPGRHPLDAAGRLVPEDLCVLEERDGRAVLTAASVCFPSHWRIGEKLGRSVAAIHAPVHHYAAELETKVDTFLRRLTPERPVVRRNVSVHDHADLFRPEPPETYDGFLGAVDDLWLRSERQTLLRLPATGAILFTIKTQQCPVPALAARPQVCRDLAVRDGALEAELARTGEPAHVPTGWVPWLEAHAGP